MKKSSEPSKRIQMMASASWLRRIDEWRGKQPGVPNRSAAIRQLADAGIEAMKKGARTR